MKFYVQLSSDGTITDIITYPHEGYVETNLKAPLEHAYHNGDWKLIGGELQFDPQPEVDVEE